jgi:hypothetical protein
VKFLEGGFLIYKMNKKITQFLSLVAICCLMHFSGVSFGQGQKGITAEFNVADRNYLPGSNIRMDVTFRNEQQTIESVTAQMEIIDEASNKVWDNRINFDLNPEQEFKVPLVITAPQQDGNYRITINNDNLVFSGIIPVTEFTVLKPEKSSRLSKILVTVPDGENELHEFVENWEIEAPSISWGQVVLCGKQTWQRFANGDKEVAQLIDRALKRSMSVIFLDFGPAGTDSAESVKIKLPFSVEAEFKPVTSNEGSFSILPEIKKMGYNLTNLNIASWNGYNGITVPPFEIQLKAKEIISTFYVRSENEPYQYPVVEIKSKKDKGKVILCQLIIEGRLDENNKSVRNRPDLPVYDPVAIQFLLNLISTSVGEELMR